MQDDSSLPLAKNGFGRWVAGEKAIGLASPCCLPCVLCHPDCTLWYLEIPVSQTKTSVWVNISSPKM